MKGINMIPMAKKTSQEENLFRFPFSITRSEKWNTEIETFRFYAGKLFGKSADPSSKGTISCCTDETLGLEEYRIGVKKEEITLCASSSKGMHNAFATLLQLIKISDDGFMEIPELEISDSPDCTYRGMMVDVGRAWHSFDYLLSYVDLCYYYKMSVLHLHFSERQLYTLPCESFEKLPTPDKHYSKEQIQYLNEYAKARGITLLPEIDIPGHCDPFLQSYPEIFGRDGIIAFTKQSFEALDQIFTEICEMFPYSPYIHMGGDEAEITNWLSQPECLAYAKSCGINFDDANQSPKDQAEIIYTHFLLKMFDIILKNKRTPVVWEGFSKKVNHLIPRDILVMSWENYYQTTPELIDAGFTLVNCSWCPLYIVTPERQWTQKEVFDWDIYTFQPVHPESPYINQVLKVEKTPLMTGGQLNAWGDFLVNADDVDSLLKLERDQLEERLAALSQNTWNVNKNITFEDFQNQYLKTKEQTQKLY